MKPVKQLMNEIKEAGLIYDPFITASIISYEAGHLLRDSFYAHLAGHTPAEEQLRAGWLADAKVELSDLVTQARVLAEVLGWSFEDLMETGEAKLVERIESYVQRGVRPTVQLMEHLTQHMNIHPDNAARFVPNQRVQRSGD